MSLEQHIIPYIQPSGHPHVPAQVCLKDQFIRRRYFPLFLLSGTYLSKMGETAVAHVESVNNFEANGKVHAKTYFVVAVSFSWPLPPVVLFHLTSLV